jgi:catechol 2,3-dioxygenase-like lactoylglutathione lyase family enzyme
MRLGYVIRYVPDVAAALAFYEAAFGLTRRFLHESGTYGELETGETTLSFAAEANADLFGFTLAAQRPDANPGATEIALVTTDVPAAYAAALAAGAGALMAPTVKPWGQTVAFVRDPDGFLVELCTPIGG